MVRTYKATTLRLLGSICFIGGLAAPGSTLSSQTSQTHSIGGVNFGKADRSPHVAQERTLQGTVVDKSGAAVPGAMVYLKEGKKAGVSVSVADAKGAYRIGPLARDTDYEVWAKVDGKTGASKLISSFNTNATIVVSLQAP